MDKTDRQPEKTDTDTAPAAHAAVHNMELDSKAIEKSKPKKTLGWRIHNEITYRGIDWLLNSCVGVLSAYIVSRTKFGEKYIQEPALKAFKTIFGSVVKSPNHLKEGGKWCVKFLAIMVGGFSIIPVMLFTENKERKKRTIRWMDEKMYGKETVANDPRFQQCYDAIDHEPKKNFKTGMYARFIAIAPLITLASIPQANMHLIKQIYDRIGKRTKQVADMLHITPKSDYWQKPEMGRREHLNGDPKSDMEWQSNWDFLHRTIGFDFGLTIFYAIMHEIAYKTLAALGMKNGKSHAKKEAAGGATPHPVQLHPTATADQGREKEIEKTTFARESRKTESPRKRSFHEMSERRDGQEAVVGA